MWGAHAWRARGARAYNGVWVDPQRGPGTEPLIREDIGAKTPEFENLLALVPAQRKQQICCILRNLQTR